MASNNTNNDTFTPALTTQTSAPSDTHTPALYAASTYSTHASFVPLLTSKITTLLSPSPHERICDIGAGNLTLSSILSTRCSYLLALDASSDMITSGLSTYPKAQYPNLDGKAVDCRFIPEGYQDGSWDKVFSNAALHWILRDPSTRRNVISNIYKMLKPGGKFVAEMGGMGNIAEIHAALTAVLISKGITVEKIRDANPWYFPDEKTMKELLEGEGFEVEVCEVEYRPTELSVEEVDGEGGITAWVKMFAERFLELVEDEKEREGVVKSVREVLEGVSRREGDGRWIAGYVRLRFVAVKK